MSSHGGGGKEGAPFPIEELSEAVQPVWEFLANLFTFFISAVLQTEERHH